MSVTETTTQSYGSRVGNAFKGILGGIVLVLAAIGLLFWNEGRAVHRANDLKECQALTKSVGSDKIDPQNEGKPIHTSGRALVGDREIADPLFPLVKAKAICINRVAEMYQWKEVTHTETTKNTGGSTTTTTTYTYEHVWLDSPIDSDGFREAGHVNPKEMLVRSEDFKTAQVTLGAFILPVDEACKLASQGFKPVLPPEATAAPAALPQPAVNPAAPQAAAPAANPAAQAAPVAPAANATLPNAVNAAAANVANAAANAATNAVNAAIGQPLPATIPAGAVVIAGRVFRYFNGYWTSSVNPATPVVGDIRIKHTFVPEQDASVVAVQKNGSFIDYRAKNDTVFLIDSGIKTAETMFADAHKANSMMTWILRLIGFVVMFVGFKMIFAPLEVLADVLPFLGNLVGYGTGFIAFLLAAGLSLLTIGVAWVFYRPLLGVLLLIAGIALIVYLFKGREKNAVPAPVDDVPPAPQA